MTWRVMVEYPLENREMMDRAIVNAVGRPFGFSGAGMGMRDAGWHVDSEIAAARIKRALKAIGVSPTVVELPSESGGIA